jgi:hypothetical protein
MKGGRPVKEITGQAQIAQRVAAPDTSQAELTQGLPVPGENRPRRRRHNLCMLAPAGPGH